MSWPHDQPNRGIQRTTLTSVMSIHNCVRCVICCQAEVCPIFPSFVHKCCGNAKAGKIAAVRSLSRNKTPHVGRAQPEWSKIRRQRFGTAVNCMAGAGASMQLKEVCAASRILNLFCCQGIGVITFFTPIFPVKQEEHQTTSAAFLEKKCILMDRLRHFES